MDFHNIIQCRWTRLKQEIKSKSEFENTMHMVIKVNNLLPYPDSVFKFENIMHMLIKWTIQKKCKKKCMYINFFKKNMGFF